MADRPTSIPGGFTGGQNDDFGILRTYDGHRAVNELTDPDLAGDINWRANVRNKDNMDIGSEDYGR